MKLGKEDKIFLIANGSFLAFCSIALAWHLNLKVGKSGNAKAVGKLTYKRYEVQRKYEERLIWEDIAADSPVYVHDSILTKDQSDATLTMEGGMTFQLVSNSMVVIESLKEKTALRLKSGKINIGSLQSDQSGKNEEITLLTESGQTINVAKGTNASLAITEDGSSHMSVNNGKISIQSEDGKVQSISKGENLSVGKDKKIKIKKVNIDLNSPANGKIWVSAGGNLDISLDWKTSGEYKRGRILVANNVSFKEARRYEISHDKNQLTVSLGAGSWYWKVETETDTDTFVSGINNFEIFHEKPPVLIMPVQNSKIEYYGDLPLVNLAWRSSRECMGVNVNISNQQNMKGTYNENIATSLSSINMKLPADGVYYWSVTCNYGGNIENTVVPEIRSFALVKLKTPPSPVPITAENQRYYIMHILNQNAILSWYPSSGVQNYTVRIYSRDKKEIAKLFPERNTLSLPDIITLGSYYWSVSANYDNGMSSKESALRAVHIVVMEQVELFKPDNNHHIGVFFDNRKQSMNFFWKKLPVDLEYKFYLARDEKFQNKITSEIVYGNIYTLKELPDNGDYYWKVEAYDKISGHTGDHRIEKTRKPLSASEVRKITLEKTLQPARLVFPVGNRELTGEDLFNMRFTWNQVPGANRYLFRIYNKTGDSSAEMLLEKTVAGNFFVLDNLAIMKNGQMVWEVVPQIVINDKVILVGINAMERFRVNGVILSRPQIIPPKPEIFTTIQ